MSQKAGSLATFNPQAPCGARPERKQKTTTDAYLSIHRLLAEPDALRTGLYELECLSIHRLLAEPDDVGFERDNRLQQLSIHRLLAEPDIIIPFSTEAEILSIHRLLAEPDSIEYPYAPATDLSIHRLLAEPDATQAALLFERQPFNPQAPCGARRRIELAKTASKIFQSTGSLRSPTGADKLLKDVRSLSIHRLLAEPDVFS